MIGAGVGPLVNWLAGIDAVLAFILGVLAALVFVLWREVFDVIDPPDRRAKRRGPSARGDDSGA